MNLDQLADEYRLNLAVPDIVERVKDVSAKEVDFRPTPNLGMRARTRMARRQMPEHVILFNPKEQPHLSHILAHECVRILRMFQIPPEDRQVAASTSDTLRAARNEIGAEAEYLPPDLREEMVDRWIHGLITQATSQPVDARIEQWISETYPGLREGQKRSLRTAIRTITASISPEVKRTAPPSVFRRSHALNYAFLTHIASIMERCFESTFRGNPQIIATGEILSEYLQDHTITDQHLVRRCAQVIDVADWFVWVSFDDAPESYHRN